MPNLNGTGPEGKGRMTGKGLGNCENSFQQRNCNRRNVKPRRNNFMLNEIDSLKKSIAELKTKLDNKN